MSPTDKSRTDPQKKPYRTPVLHFYGAIRTITANLGSMTAADGGSAPKTKTA